MNDGQTNGQKEVRMDTMTDGQTAVGHMVRRIDGQTDQWRMA